MEFDYPTINNNAQDILYYAQVISDAFSKTLESNNCLLMLPIALHQQINESLKDVVDTAETISNSNNFVPTTGSNPDQILDSLYNAIQDSKSKCFSCKIDMPKLKFNIDLSGAVNNLNAQLNLFKDTFRLKKLDLCQTSYAFQSSCLPDILKLITLLLTAYIAIMGLKKISNISISAFIKGIISSILSALLGSVNITVNISSSTIGCLIEAFREITLALPTEENIRNGLDVQTNNSFASGSLSSSIVKNLNNGLGVSSNKLKDTGSYIVDTQKDINESFQMVSKTLDNSVKKVNEYIQSLLNFKIHCECEVKRSGINVEESFKEINNLTNVLNMLSAVALSIAKKDIRDKICKTEKAINNKSNSSIDDIQLKDIIEDYNQRQTQIVNSTPENLEVLIYEQPKVDSLPKIDILNCSIDDFIEAHTIENIIQIASKQVEKEIKQNTNIKTPSASYIFNKPNIEDLTTIRDIINIIYNDPKIDTSNQNKDELIKNILDSESVQDIVISPESLINPIGKNGNSELFKRLQTEGQVDSNLQCRSIEDVLNTLQQFRR